MSSLTRLEKRLEKLERVQAKRDPVQIAKRFLSDEDRGLLEELNYDRAAFDEAHVLVWFRWESALEDARAGRKYAIPVLSDVYARL